MDMVTNDQFVQELTTTEEKVVELLGRGYSQSIVASSVGVDDSYISQLLSLEHIREAVTAIKLKHLHSGVELDDSVDTLEEAALAKLHKLLPYVQKPMDALRIYQVANAAKRKAPEVTNTSDSKAPVVVINLPSVMAVQFKMSSDRQVTEINGKSMAALPSKSLNQKLLERRANVPLLSDSASAASMLNNLEKVPNSIVNVL